MDPCIGKDLHQSTNVVNRYAHDLLHLEFLAHKSMASVYSPRSTSTPAQRRTTTQRAPRVVEVEQPNKRECVSLFSPFTLQGRNGIFTSRLGYLQLPCYYFYPKSPDLLAIIFDLSKVTVPKE